MRLILAVVLGWCGTLTAGEPQAVWVAAPDDAAAAAWVRFGDGEQSYKGVPYHFLGGSELQVTFDKQPQPGSALELLWGSKKDRRTALVEINGRSLVLSRGGDYDGFRWLRVPLPEVAGVCYQIGLKPGEGKAAFLAEIRLTLPGGDPQRSDLKEPVYKAKLVQKAADYRGFEGEAFPAMRKVWDREPAAAARNAVSEALFRQAERNGRCANEAFFRCRRYVDGWLAHCDPQTGLFPRNLGPSNYWNGRDSAADNYPFMVLTAAMTDRPLLEGRLREILRTEIKLTCRVDRLPDDYSLATHSWRREKVNLDEIIFDSAEYVKDGLLYIAEWLGPGPWSERMTGIVEDIWKNAPIETPSGKIPTLNFEVNGDLLQACARLYWFTGQRKYLDWAIRLGDYYLLGDHHPVRDMTRLGLMDHACEVINGLSELYVACAHAAPEKRRAYEKPLHEIFDRILAIGRNDDGLLYTWINPKTGAHGSGLCDTWGYDYDGFYTMYLMDRTGAYRDAVCHALANLKGKYVGACWADKSADGFADSIEGAINLFNREPVVSAADWIESQTRMMWAKQHPDGVIEGWHGDGNFARTSLMYALWRTAGATVEPWRADVRFGAVCQGAKVYLSLVADQPWTGRLIFDKPRHKLLMHLPLDYPRINQFPEWFTAQAGQRYHVHDVSRGGQTARAGEELQAGVALSLPAGNQVWLIVEPAP